MKGKNKMFEKIKELIAEELGADAATITKETTFDEDLGADSLDLFDLVMKFEDERFQQKNLKILRQLEMFVITLKRTNKNSQKDN